LRSRFGESICPTAQAASFAKAAIILTIASISEADERQKFSLFAARAANSAHGCWRGLRDWGAFPRSNGFDYDLDPGQCALDFTLHALNLRVQKSLQFLEFGR
jgi:hypothetical protein